jgi:hypothetical protein
MSGCIRITVHHARMTAAGMLDELPAVATLRERQEVDGVFACTRKERRLSRAGTPF